MPLMANLGMSYKECLDLNFPQVLLILDSMGSMDERGNATRDRRNKQQQSRMEMNRMLGRG